MGSVKDLIVEWDEVTKIKIFEVEVMNIDIQESEYIVFNISSSDKGLIATPSEYLSDDDILVEWDDAFTLDSHIQTLRDECSDAIMNSDKWEEI